MSGCFSTQTRLFLLLAVLLSVQGNIIHGHQEDGNGENKAPNRKVGEMAKLEILLMNNWKEMDRMLLCTKTRKCVKTYPKNMIIGNTVVKANLIQSLGFTLDNIKQLTNRVKEIKR